jgi:hypothetical protein
MGIIDTNSRSNVATESEEIALKLNIEFTPLNGWHHCFTKHGGLSYGTMKRESKIVFEMEVGTRKM